jgi:hypothetical protein
MTDPTMKASRTQGHIDDYPEGPVLDTDIPVGGWLDPDQIDDEPRIYRALDAGQDPDAIDYGGAFDGFTVTSDADPGL